jgi:hypothetical protein
MGYGASTLKIQMEIGRIKMQKKCDITAGRHKVLLTYFVQDYSNGCPDYGCHRKVFCSDCELFPPFLIILLVSSCPVEEVISIIP